jgi:hypothetical protein
VCLLLRTNPEATVQTSEPAPLSRQKVVEMLTQVASHPAYRDQTFNLTSADLVEVSLVKGKVQTGFPA